MNANVSNPLESLQDRLATIKHCDRKSKKNTYLFKEGDIADSVFLIHSGKVRIGKITPDGREITFRICSAGDIISEIALFCERSTYKVHGKVMQDCHYAKINIKDLEEHLLLHPSTNIELIRMMSIQHQKSQSKFRDLILHGKKGALYSTLIRMTNSYGIDQQDGILIDYPFKNQELANFCGMSRELVNRHLNALRSEGIISMPNSRILIHDLDHLKAEIHCENCPVDICSID